MRAGVVLAVYHKIFSYFFVVDKLENEFASYLLVMNIGLHFNLIDIVVEKNKYTYPEFLGHHKFLGCVVLSDFILRVCCLINGFLIRTLIFFYKKPLYKTTHPQHKIA